MFGVLNSKLRVPTIRLQVALCEKAQIGKEVHSFGYERPYNSDEDEDNNSSDELTPPPKPLKQREKRPSFMGLDIEGNLQHFFFSRSKQI